MAFGILIFIIPGNESESQEPRRKTCRNRESGVRRGDVSSP
jgi:hypothetical protein